jgi:hypothetical protein
MGQYENIFGCKPREYTSLLEKGNNTEVDCSDEINNKSIKRYQTIIGCLQCAVSLGRFDVQPATMAGLRFCSAPRQGHLNRLKRIYGYLKKITSGAI